MSAPTEQPDDLNLHSHYVTGHAALIIVFAVLASIAATLRIYARRIQGLALSLSDYVLILGLMFSLAESSLNLYACCLPEEWRSSYQQSATYQGLNMKLAFALPMVWIVAVTTIRASMIFLYIHIFPKRSFRNICYGVLAFNLVFLVSFIVAKSLNCRPVAMRWDWSIRDGSCGNEKALDLYVAGGNLLQDAIIVVLPMGPLLGLQMARHRKFGVCCLFGLGTTICAVTAYRVYVTSTITSPTAPRSQEAYALIALLTSIEALLGIITACLPMLRPIVTRCWNILPKSSQGKISDLSSSARTVLFKLSLPAMSHGTGSWNWFSSKGTEREYARQESFEGKYPALKRDEREERGLEEKGKGKAIHVRSDVDVESVFSDM